MVKADLTIKSKVMRVCSLLTLLILLASSPLFPNSHEKGLLDVTLACNDNVNVSLSGTCEAIITPDVVLEGEESIPGYDPANYEVTIDGVTGPSVTLSLPGVYQVSIFEIPTGNSCWGHVTVEDKLAPLLECDCPEGGEAFDEFSDSFTGGDPSIPTCDIISGGFDGPDAFYQVHNFAVNEFTTNFSANFTSHTLGCDQVGVIYAGNFDPDNPCANIIASGDDDTGLLVSQLPVGIYQLVIYLDVADLVAPCNYTVNTNMELFMFDEECMFTCNQADGITASPQTIPTPTPDATEECTDFTSDYNDEVVDFGCSSKKIFRTWIFTDEHGNSSTCTQEFLLKPISLVDVVPPNPIVEIPCEYEGSPDDIYDFFLDQGNSEADAANYAYPTINELPFTELVCGLAITYEDHTIELCEGEYKIVREWLAVDWCSGTVEEYVQIIKLVDDGLAVTCPTDGMVFSVDHHSCTGTAELPPPTVADGSCSTLTYKVGFLLADTNGNPPPDAVYTFTNVVYPITSNAVIFNLPLGRSWIQYEVSDACGRTASCFTEVDLEDNTPPVPVCQEFTVISLTTLGWAHAYAESFNSGSHDNCTDVEIYVRRMDGGCDDPDVPMPEVAFEVGNIDYFDYEAFCCADIADNPIMIELIVVDAFGNYNTCMVEATIQDKLPTSLMCPDDISIDCSDDIDDLDLTGRPTATGSCGDVPTSYTDNTSGLNDCGIGVVRRTWRITGTNMTCLQRITVGAADPFNGFDITWPQDMTVDCEDLGENIPTWDENVCAQVGYTLDSDTFFIETGACFKILNSFTVIDWCVYDSDDPLDESSDGVWQHIQTIKVEDNNAPIVNCTDITVEADDFWDDDNDGITCESKNVTITANATDIGNCMSNWLKWEVTIDFWGDGNVDEIYSSFVPFNSSNYISPTMSGEELSITLDSDIPGSMNNHIIQWYVTDGCGNGGSCSSNLMVVDNKPPTPYCLNVSTALMDNGELEIWACDFDLGSFDNCSTTLKFTFNDNYDSPEEDPKFDEDTNCSYRLFTCDDLPAVAGEPITLDIFVWDEKDNYDYCTVTLTLVDNTGSCDDNSAAKLDVLGKIRTEDGKSVENVEVVASSNSPEFPKVEYTDENGQYAFDDNPALFNYTLTPELDNDHLNGVTTLDILLMQKHILGTQVFDSPYKYIAADINNDQSVSAIDLVELRKIILGIYPEFPVNKSWRFVDESQVLIPTQPWPFSELIQINGLMQNLLSEDFVGVKVGDVNESVTPNFANIVSDTRTGQTLEFVTEQMEDGKIAFIAGEGFNDVYGYQFAMHIGNAGNVTGVTPAAIEVNTENFGINAAGTLTTSYHSLEPMDFAEGTLLFTLDTDVTTTLELVEDQLRSEAYMTSELNVINVSLRNKEHTSLGYALHQNQPNPFSETTTIHFNLGQAGKTTIRFFDVAGRLIRQMNGDYDKGVHSMTLNKEDLGNNAIIYYQLQSGTFTATRKMIIIQ